MPPTVHWWRLSRALPWTSLPSLTVTGWRRRRPKLNLRCTSKHTRLEYKQENRIHHWERCGHLLGTSSRDMPKLSRRAHSIWQAASVWHPEAVAREHAYTSCKQILSVAASSPRLRMLSPSPSRREFATCPSRVWIHYPSHMSEWAEVRRYQQVGIDAPPFESLGPVVVHSLLA